MYLHCINLRKVKEKFVFFVFFYFSTKWAEKMKKTLLLNKLTLRGAILLGPPCTVIPPNARFLGLRKGPRVWKPRIWVHIYVVKVKKGAEPFSKVHFLGDFEVRCSQMDVLPTVLAPLLTALE